MTDLRLDEAFSDLEGAAPDGLDRAALAAAIVTAHRRRRRLQVLLAGAGIVGVAVALVLVVPGANKDSLVPAKLAPTPLQTYTLRAQPGRITYLPKDCTSVTATPPDGLTHYEVYGVPHAHANTIPNPTEGDVIRFAAVEEPAVPPGQEAGTGTPAHLTHGSGTYFEPSGPYNVAVFRWNDGAYNYRLQGPIKDPTHVLGVTYRELLKVANSVSQGHRQTTRAVTPRPTPSGYLASPGPDILRYWSPYFYAARPPSDAHPKVTAEQALAKDRASSSQGPQTGKTPHQFLALVTLVPPQDYQTGQPLRGGYRNRLAWVIEFGGIATDDTQGHFYTSCTSIYIVDAITGEPFHDEVACPPKRTPTPATS